MDQTFVVYNFSRNEIVYNLQKIDEKFNETLVKTYNWDLENDIIFAIGEKYKLFFYNRKKVFDFINMKGIKPRIHSSLYKIYGADMDCLEQLAEEMEMSKQNSYP